MTSKNGSSTTMPQPLMKLTLFASSTSEGAAELSALRTVIDGLNRQLESAHAITLRMVSWPDDVRPGVNTDPQSEINRQITGYDIYLGILGTRFGTPTPRNMSGTQEEFEAALSRFKSDTTSVRLLFYFKKSLVGIDPYQLDVDDLQKVQCFRVNLEARGVLYRDFENTEGFIDLVKTHLFDLIAEEWHADTGKWTSIDTPTQPPTSMQGRPQAERDTRSGNAARPKNRTSESKRKVLPDEDDPEDSDDDEGDDLGLLDHVENLRSVVNAMSVTFTSMSEHITSVGSKIGKRTKEIDDVKQSQAKARTVADSATQQRNISRFKDIINGAADDITEFVGDLAQDVTVYRVDNRVMLSEMRALLVARRELGVENDDSNEELTALLTLVETMKTVKGQVGRFQQAMQEAPALTGKFKKARRRGVSMLGELIAEISLSIDEIVAIVKSVGKTYDSEMSPSG